MLEGKIIWTKKELEDWHAKHPLKEFSPLASISASRLSETKAKETSRVQGIISHIGVRFPSLVSPATLMLVAGKLPPSGWAAGLVNVSISLNDKTLVPELSGDNREDSFLFATPITKGDIVKVIVKNADTKWSHSIGVRVDVKQQKGGGK